MRLREFEWKQRREREGKSSKKEGNESVHQPVLLLSEEVNFHASGWTMWTAPLLLLKSPARLTATKGGTSRRQEKIKKKKKK